MLSLGNTAQSAETVGNRLSFVDKIPSQAPSMHEPEDADAEDADDDDEGLQSEASARRSRTRGSKQPSDFVGQVKKARVNPMITPEL